MYSKLLVPLDGSDLAEAVLPYVAELARRFGSEVILLAVVESLEEVVTETTQPTEEPTKEPATSGEALAIDVAETIVDAEHEHADDYLQRARHELQTQGIATRVEVVEGNARHDIVRYAGEHGIDLIAMSTHGRSGLRRLVNGSVTDAVLRSAPCPLLVVRSQEHHKKE